MRALKNWQGPLPSKMGLCEPYEDLILIRKFSMVEAEMRGVEDHEKEKKRKEKALEAEARRNGANNRRK